MMKGFYKHRKDFMIYSLKVFREKTLKIIQTPAEQLRVVRQAVLETFSMRQGHQFVLSELRI